MAQQSLISRLPYALSVLLFCIFAAQPASAVASKGITAFTCAETATGFSDAHCKLPSGTGKFSHVAFAENTPTITGWSNNLTGFESEVWRLKATIAGIATELQATGLTGTGTMTNKKAASGEHYAHGEGKITYTGVSVAKPEGAGCKVKGGSIVTNTLTATTEGQGDSLKLTPKEGTEFGAFTIEGCGGAFTGLNKEYKAEGSVSGTLEGGTTRFTHAAITLAHLFKLNGSIIAAIEGRVTISGTNGNALSSTTVETP